MMDPRTRATRESVFAACDELLLLGQYPSARAVVAKTKGSLSTVGPLRDEWWRLLAEKYRETKYLKGVPRDASDFLTGVWATASSLAAAAFDDQAARLKQTLVEREAELGAARASIASFQADLQLSQDSVAGLSDQVAQLQAAATHQATEHAAEIATLRDQLRVAHEANSRQAADAQAAAAEASRRLADSAEAAADERRRLLVQVDTARQESVRLAEAASVAASRHSAAIESLNTRLDAAGLAAEHASREAAAARTESATLSARLTAAEHANAALREERDSIAARLAASAATVVSQGELLAAQAAASQAINGTLNSLKRLLESERNTDPQNPRSRARKKSVE